MTQTLSPEATRAIDKIQKLLALARDNASEGEAEAAMNMAHELLEAHNISMAQIERVHAKTSTTGVRADETGNGGLYKWQTKIWEETAKLNFSLYFRIRGLGKGSKYQHRVIGRPENVIMTRMMAEYLEGAIERLAREWAKDRGYKSCFVSEAIQYREGMAETIGNRLNTMRWEREQEARRREAEAQSNGTGTAVTIFGVKTMEDDFNNDYVNGWEPGTTAARRAEREADYARWIAECKQAADEKAARILVDPVFAAQCAAEAAALKAAQEKYAAAQEKKQRRREKSYSYGYRRENAEDRRKYSAAYQAGVRKGHDVGLDPQVRGGNGSKRIS